MLRKESSKQKVINIFKKHHSKLNKVDIYQWLRYAADLTDRYIGPETQLGGAWENLLRYESSNLSQRSSSLLEQCIESIEDNGLYKPPKSNFLMTLTNGELSTLISTVLIASIGGAWFLGISYNQFRIDNLNQENVKLEVKLKKAESVLLTAQKDLVRIKESHPISNTLPASSTSTVISKPMAVTTTH